MITWSDMNIPIPISEFTNFIVMAKCSTYASSEDNARVDPNLPGSHQLEFRRGAFFYRDIYFGGGYFVGLETVFFTDNPIWAMSYAGGINDEVEPTQCLELYKFLKSALREVNPTAPYRGPIEFLSGEYAYLNRFLGQISRFSGVETISYSKKPVYQLHYSGGILKK